MKTIILTVTLLNLHSGDSKEVNPNSADKIWSSRIAHLGIRNIQTFRGRHYYPFIKTEPFALHEMAEHNCILTNF